MAHARRQVSRAHNRAKFWWLDRRPNAHGVQRLYHRARDFHRWLVRSLDWEPLQAYPIGALGAIGLVPVFVLVSAAIEVARTTTLTAAAVLSAAGVIASIVYALVCRGLPTKTR